MRRLRLAVDAGNLVRDRRGLGRVTRGILAAADAGGGFEISLLAAKRDDARALASEFPQFDVAGTKSAAKRGAYDLVWYPFNGVRFRSAGPSLVTIADAFAFTHAHPDRFARAREQRPIRRAAREATHVVTISAWSRAELERELAIPPQKISVVPLAPGDYWCPGAGDTLPAGIAGKRFALVVGVREPRKNARLALAAFARAQRDPDDLLVIAGELSKENLAYAKSLGVRAGCIAPGDALLRSLYRNATVVLVPSLAEGFGLVAVEALACGAPVIASASAALPEATRGAAVLLDPQDVPAWSAAIRHVYDDAFAAAELRARAVRASAADRGAPAAHMLALFRRFARG